MKGEILRCPLFRVDQGISNGHNYKNYDRLFKKKIIDILYEILSICMVKGHSILFLCVFLP
jgi:hypothetical protein